MILLCAATSVEARACRAGTARATERFETLQTGMGLVAAEKRLSARLEKGPKPSLIVSTGFAGSWSRTYRVGDWVIGKSTAYESENAPLDPAALGILFREDPGLPRADYRSLARAGSGSGELLVDLESFAWARVARERGIPFAILRLVSDSPEAPLPEAIADFASGAVMKGLRGVLSEPGNFARFIARGSRLPGMLRDGWVTWSELLPFSG